MHMLLHCGTAVWSIRSHRITRTWACSRHEPSTWHCLSCDKPRMARFRIWESCPAFYRATKSPNLCGLRMRRDSCKAIHPVLRLLATVPSRLSPSLPPRNNLTKLALCYGTKSFGIRVHDMRAPFVQLPMYVCVY